VTETNFVDGITFNFSPLALRHCVWGVVTSWSHWNEQKTTSPCCRAA